MDAKQIYEQSTRHFLAPVLSLIDDPKVSEILINGHETVYYEREGTLQLSELKFSSAEFLMAAARNIAEYVNRHVGGDDHSMDARLPDGSRVHVIVPPSSRQGVCISIRKFQKSRLDMQSLIQYGSLSEEAAEFLEMVVLLHKNTIVSGGTGTGKTSMLNALSAAIPDSERVVVIEDSSELQLRQSHAIYLEAQPPRPDGKGEVTIRDLFVDSLRMRPDRIIVGEVRRGEALDLIQSMISGHAGALTTVHASTARDAVVRLETLCLMSDVSLPMHVARTQVASAVEIVVQIARFNDGSRKVLTISECLGLGDEEGYMFQDLYRFQGSGRAVDGQVLGELKSCGIKPSFAAEPFTMGYQDRLKLCSQLFSPP